MQRVYWIFVLFFTASLFFTAACSNDEQVSTKDVKDSVSEAVETTGAYMAQQKEEAVKDMQQGLEALDRKREALQAKMADLSDEARQDLQHRLDQLKAEQQKLEERLEELKTASGQAYEEMKAGLEQSLNDLQDAYKRALDAY